VSSSGKFLTDAENCLLKVQDHAGKLFQVVGPATANERGPQVDNFTDGTTSWLLCDDRPTLVAWWCKRLQVKAPV